jgi:Na+/glutamate symporter
MIFILNTSPGFYLSNTLAPIPFYQIANYSYCIVVGLIIKNISCLKSFHKGCSYSFDENGKCFICQKK